VPTDKEFMNIHVQALFTHDAHSSLLFVNEPNGSKQLAPRFFLGRTKSGNLWRFRADVPKNLVNELAALCLDEPLATDLQSRPRHFESYVKLLETQESVQNIWLGPAYHFTEMLEPSRPLVVITKENAELLQGGFEKLIDELADWQPFLAVVEDGRAVSVCRSVRITPRAHEAGLETLLEFRGKGHAKDVVAGWARSVQATGALPLYSTSWENTASQSVARKLQLLTFGADFHIT
jgi:hypothetical protein